MALIGVHVTMQCHVLTTTTMCVHACVCVMHLCHIMCEGEWRVHTWWESIENSGWWEMGENCLAKCSAFLLSMFCVCTKCVCVCVCVCVRACVRVCVHGRVHKVHVLVHMSACLCGHM